MNSLNLAIYLFILMFTRFLKDILHPSIIFTIIYIYTSIHKGSRKIK